MDACGTVSDDTNYDSRFDFNSDGLVDMGDLLILVESFGT